MIADVAAEPQRPATTSRCADHGDGGACADRRSVCSWPAAGYGTTRDDVALEHWSTADDGYVVFGLAGDVDIAVREELTAALADAAERVESTLIVDLDRVALLAAAGFHCLEQVAELLSRSGRQLYLVCGEGRPARRILGILDDHYGWALYATVPAAVRSVPGAARR